MDIRLLDILGFKDAIRILTEEKTKLLQYETQMMKRAHLEDGIFGVPGAGGDEYKSKDINALGTGNYDTSVTQIKRNPEAERMAGKW